MPEVLEAFEDLVERCIRDQDRRGYFAALYLGITKALSSEIAGRNTFEHADLVEALDVAFANRYLTSLAEYDRGELTGRCWIKALDAARSDRLVIMQQLLVTINAHINIDLGIATARSIPLARMDAFRGDFDKVNGVIAALTPAIESDIDRLSPVSYRIDQFLGHAIERKVLDFSLDRARDSAWELAQRLAAVPPAEQNAIIAQHDADHVFLADLILTPTLMIRWIHSQESADVAANIRTLEKTGTPHSMGPPPAVPLAPGRGEWSDELLDSVREHTDPEGDAVIQSLFEAGEIDSVRDLWKTLVHDDEVVPEDLPEVVRDYFEKTAALPDWADPDLLHAGQEFFESHGLAIVAALNCASLPEAYAAGKGVQVLWLNGRLYTDTKRRVMETAQLFFDVLQVDGLGDTGDGIRSLQKVRLLHAAIRHMILASDQWNDEWGAPINQEDLLGTLMTFSRIVVDALDRFAVDYEPDAAEAYLHTWKVASHFLGIRPDLLPGDLADATVLIDTIRRRQFVSTEAGRELSKALVGYMDDMLPGTVFDGFPSTTIRFLVGDATADLLDIPEADWTRVLNAGLARLLCIEGDLNDHGGVIGRAIEHFGHALLTGFLWIERGGNRHRFVIPDHLGEAWKIGRADINPPGR